MANKDLLKRYNQQRNRIKRFIKQAEDRGFRFEYELPKNPKKITEASIRKLEKIKPEYLYNKATYLDPETGKIVGGTEGRRIERSTTAKKGAKTRFNKTDTVNKPNTETETIRIPPPENFSIESLPDSVNVIIDYTLKEKFEYWTEKIDENYELLKSAEQNAYMSVLEGEFSNALTEEKYRILNKISALLDVSTPENRLRVAMSLKEFEDTSPLENALHDIAYESETEKIKDASDLIFQALTGGKPLTATEALAISEMSEQ